MAGHAKLSPSSAERWMTCPGSVALSEGYADSSSAAADEGTAAHELAERILLGAKGDELVGLRAQNGIEWTAEMLQDVLRYTQSVQALAGAVGDALMVEQRLPISEWTGEAGAHGTADAVILAGTELIVADLKFGRGVVVDADENKQLRIYALAALREFEFVGGPFETVRIIISQPRLGAWSEWTCTVAELEAFGDEVKAAHTGSNSRRTALVNSAPNANTLFGCVRMANSTTDSGGFLIFGGGSISASQPATGRMMCGVQSRFTVTSPRISHLRM